MFVSSSKIDITIIQIVKGCKRIRPQDFGFLPNQLKMLLTQIKIKIKIIFAFAL